MVKLQRFKNRMQAGELLAYRLAAYTGRPDVIVLALPRGGVPVGFAVANKLEVPLDILLIRKLGLPGQEEYAMGAIASGGTRILQDEVLRNLKISDRVIERVTQRELHEIHRREKLYRGHRLAPQLQNRVVILVDDGLAVGSTMQVAVQVVRKANPARVIVAVPVAAPEAYKKLKPKVDEIICMSTPEPFYAVGMWYKNFGQTTDEEVKRLLHEAERMRTHQASFQLE